MKRKNMKINQMKRFICLRIYLFIKSAELRQTRAEKLFGSIHLQAYYGTTEGKIMGCSTSRCRRIYCWKSRAHARAQRSVIVTPLKSIKLPCDCLKLASQTIQRIFGRKPPVDVQELRDYLAKF